MDETEGDAPAFLTTCKCLLAAFKSLVFVPSYGINKPGRNDTMRHKHFMPFILFFTSFS